MGEGGWEGGIRQIEMGDPQALKRVHSDYRDEKWRRAIGEPCIMRVVQMEKAHGGGRVEKGKKATRRERERERERARQERERLG